MWSRRAGLERSDGLERAESNGWTMLRGRRGDPAARPGGRDRLPVDRLAPAQLLHRDEPAARRLQPAAGDAGGSLGAAYTVWYTGFGKKRTIKSNPDSMQGSYLGPEYNSKDILKVINKFGAQYTHYEEFNKLTKDAAMFLTEGKVVGWFQGRMEFGPRALGNRSIIGDARNPEMQKKMNLKIKYRESFRPFAPSVLEEKVSKYFKIDRPSPYMLLVADVKEEKRFPQPSDDGLSMPERLKVKRSDIPAVTHLDYSARLQSVNKRDKPDYHAVISEFEKLTGCAVIVNTSFNVRGEPIICTPEDAYRCFMRTEMDILVMEDCILFKEEQPSWEVEEDWRSELELD